MEIMRCCQCMLDKEGATDLVVDLIIGNYSNRIFRETIELGIALLDGGNCVIQVPFASFVHLFCGPFSGTTMVSQYWKNLHFYGAGVMTVVMPVLPEFSC